MKDVSKLLFDDKQKANPLGRDLLLAQFVTFYIQFADSAKRGDVGFPGDKLQYVDMLKFADSLFTIVETAEPKCKLQTLGWRNYKPYTDRMKAGYAAVGAGAADTAEKLANRAIDAESLRRPAVRHSLARRGNPERRSERSSVPAARRRHARGRHAERSRALELPVHARPQGTGVRRKQDRQGGEGQAVSRCGRGVHEGVEGIPGERRSAVRDAGNLDQRDHRRRHVDLERGCRGDQGEHGQVQRSDDRAGRRVVDGSGKNRRRRFCFSVRPRRPTRTSATTCTTRPR